MFGSSTKDGELGTGGGGMVLGSFRKYDIDEYEQIEEYASHHHVGQRLNLQPSEHTYVPRYLYILGLISDGQFMFDISA